MEIKQLTRDVKATLYERVSSPFFGSFLISWLLTNHTLIATLLFSDISGKEKVVAVDTVFNTPWILWQKPILLTLGVVSILPIINTVVFSWSEKIKNIKHRIRYSIEGGTLIPIEKLRDFEASSANRLAKYNELIISYENKIGDLQKEVIVYSESKSELESTLSDLKLEMSAELSEAKVLLNKEKVVSEKYKSEIDDLFQKLSSYKDYNDIVEENLSLQKQAEQFYTFLKKRDVFSEPEKVFIDLPHMNEFEIKRLIYEVKELGLMPIFDGDAKGIVVHVPCYIESDSLRSLAERYRADCLVGKQLENSSRYIVTQANQTAI